MKGIEYCILLLVSIICWAACVPTTDEWDEFKRKFNKRYESETEEVYRMKIFHEKLKYIAEQNLRFVNGEISYSSGINKFSDLTYEEFESRFTGYFINPNVIRANASESTFPTKSDSVELTRPDSLDWREIGAVTPVKNEGRCQSGWAFSAIGTLEGYHFMKTGKLVSFSEQQLVDCDQDDDGCIGGSPYVALMYAKNNGITLESSYPYEGKQGDCRINSTHKVVRCNGVRALPMFNEEELKIAVNTIGPIAVELHVNCALANYARGVFDHPTCHRNLNHAALLVGYDTTTDGRDYWIVKNSWGEEWGEQGYIRIIRHKNMCRIADSAMYPI